MPSSVISLELKVTIPVREGQYIGQESGYKNFHNDIASNKSEQGQNDVKNAEPSQSVASKGSLFRLSRICYHL